MTIKFNLTAVDSMFDQAQAVAAQLPREAYDKFRQETPYRSGNAYRNTRLNGSTIDANYPYAQRLDDGYSSQRPEGMTQPTTEFLQRRIAELIRKIK